MGAVRNAEKRVPCGGGARRKTAGTGVVRREGDLAAAQARQQAEVSRAQVERVIVTAVSLFIIAPGASEGRETRPL
ncbi:hypothetical protein Ssi02_66490 [Sinosporangium siamense]|uniref:Uncharacterized protein n=1 Tax=Sinosporangium siamense TaxID=1367973 RepID=A0A919RME0_9ACTN|nr:hypothetical protein Ssi02_66490 [Sinosporangium siamense]